MLCGFFFFFFSAQVLLLLTSYEPKQYSALCQLMNTGYLVQSIKTTHCLLQTYGRLGNS